ncbi:MAG: NTF2-like N-terminal transpeptidase domain-containing protein, partial [Nocardioidaceae bacterium]
MTRFGKRVRTMALSCVLLIGLVGLSGCSDDEESDPQGTAESLATALSDADVSEVAFDGTPADDAQQDLKTALSGMDGNVPEVAVGDVEEDGDTATATLEIAWSLGEKGGPSTDWSYETEATLRKSGEDWQPEWSLDLLAKGLRDDESLTLTRTPGDRGPVLGAGDQKIVKDRPVVRIGLDKAKTSTGSIAASARELAGLVDIDAGDYVEKVEAYGPDAFVEAIVLRRRDAAEVDAGEFRRIDGALQIADTLPLAPTAEFAAPILGSVGEATAELIKESDGELAPGDITGLSGLQQRYDEQLRGEPGLAVDAVKKSGKD